MVHYGWACAASWQMLRHASVWEPAGRGRGRRDAVATQQRLTQAVPSCFSLQSQKKKKEKNCLTVCCNMTSTEPSGKLSVHQHPRLKGERFAFLCAASAQIDCDQPSANIALPPMRQNVWQQEAGMQPDCFSTAG